MPKRIAALIAKMKANQIPVPSWLVCCQPTPARTFRSSFPFWVWYEPPTGGYLQVGQTPGCLDIPESLVWWVEPDQSSDYDMLTVAREMQRQQVPGLTLRESPVTELGLLQLVDLTHLRRLHLRDCQELSLEGLLCLRDKPHLHTLTIADCPWMTDQGLELLSELPALSELNLASCHELTGEGLKSLARCRRLSTLFLSWSPQIVKGLEYLRRQRPDLQITTPGSPEDIRRRYARI